MIKMTAKYLGIGFLFGIGFSIEELISYEIYGKQQAKEVEESLKHALNEVSETNFVRP
ncbi:hypothetical protein R50072_11340 [Simiduia litorea]|uniref:hypothetical protein n=1 Tax=Simiduia litorea TaxID=1435348 RepID=UPI0036F3FC5B